MGIVNRADRDTEHALAARGGSMVLRQINAAGEIIPDSAYFDIERYTLTHIFKNKITTHSGHNGGTRRTRTGEDWRFSAVMSAPSSNFVQMYLGHFRGVALTFNMGDPEIWEGYGLDVLTYRADKALLTSVRILNDPNSGEGVVMAEIEGEGSSPLWGYVGDTAISAELWP